VIITNHSTTSNDHGQHQATALMVVEAFDAAADPNKFSEQLKNGVTTWQVQRLFVRARSNQAADANAQIVTIDPNERDPIRGTMFAEQALAALQKHATQGPWPKTVAEYTARFRAFSGQSGTTGQMPLIRYRLEREAKGTGALPKNLHNFFDGLQLPETVAKAFAPVMTEFHRTVELIEDRKSLLQQLLGYQTNISNSYNDYFKQAVSQRMADERKPNAIHRFLLIIQRLERSLALAEGIDFKLVPSILVTPNSTAALSFTVANHGSRSFAVYKCDTCPPGSICIDDPPIIVWSVGQALNVRPPKVDSVPPGTELTATATLRIPDNIPVNAPLSMHLYDPVVLPQELITRCSIEIPNRITVTGSTHINVAPAVEILSVTPSPFVITPDATKKSHPFQVQLLNHTASAIASTLTVGALDNTMDASGPILKKIQVSLQANETKTLAVELTPRDLNYRSLKTSVMRGGYKLDFAISTPALGAKQIASVRDMPFVDADAHTAPNLSVGYIRGFDFSLPNALNALGVESKELTVDDVKTADLSKYTSIIVDNRVYESQPALIAVNQKLLDYAKAGGNLIVFYHKSDEWNPDPRRNRPQLAPYKLILGNERITDENAPITFIEPDHPLLNLPNKIGPDDFKDWIQERGLYYPREWDPQFHALLQSNDPGEGPLKGGLLVADHGKGHYIYSSMVWYRQLRAGVPGAYRMLANMISYGREGKGKSQ